uniref:BRMS1 transcriptional repressor and anoikis regulator n=1 Tax=Molossus molossus TaxID=27622 RepID=A0A7J8ENC1_MOLMO|nr:BRMS1 transcriptional repressor and anoikis regulator [Molossus molossus]
MPIQPPSKDTEDMEGEGDSAAEMNGEEEESEEERSGSQTESEEESSEMDDEDYERRRSECVNEMLALTSCTCCRRSTSWRTGQLSKRLGQLYPLRRESQMPPLTCNDFPLPTYPQDLDPVTHSQWPCHLGASGTKPRICIFLLPKGRLTSPSGSSGALPSSHHRSGLLPLRAWTAVARSCSSQATLSSIPNQPLPSLPEVRPSVRSALAKTCPS